MVHLQTAAFTTLGGSPSKQSEQAQMFKIKQAPKNALHL
jgi:hypothetical protein